ncbi:membrane protein insertase YidC [Candidatus Daviesbacteria bacterium]|nr:membrane protein insertase YidC [Candidatus Daviesbacteria bacterium]
MGAIGDIFNTLFLIPIINLLLLIYYGLNSLHIPGSLGFALIILTVLIRLLVWPVMTSQIKATKKMADLKPHLDELKRKHKDDKQAMASAQMALYKEHGVNPAGGCLPALIQIPIFIGLYQAIINILPGMQNGNLGWINSILYFPWLHLDNFPDPNFFGLNLGAKPSDFSKYGISLVSVPLITALLTFVQSKMTLPRPIKHYPSDSPKEEKEKESMEDSMSAVQSQMVFLMPIMIGYFAFTFPVGLAIYWNAYTILGIIQQHRIAGWGGMADFVGKFKTPSTK